MKRLIIKTTVVMWLALIYSPLNQSVAQDIDAMIRSAWFRHSGQASAELNLSRDRQGKAEWNYNLSAQYRPVIKGIAIPLGLSYNRFSGLGTQLPFNRWYIAPQYRWIRGQIGRGSMTFSPYTLNGLEFTGIGLELSPGDHWNVAAMYGTLSRAGRQSMDQSLHQRRAWAAKLQYQQEAYRLGFSVLHAWDVFDQNLNTAPSANIALSINGAVRILDQVELQAELARSTIMSQVDQSPMSTIWRRFFGSKPTLNHESHLAYKLSLGHPILNLSYEQVDPRYRSFGTYYEQNNFRNLSLNSQYVLKQWQFGLRMGLQQNNLDDSQVESSRKWVWAAMAHGGLGKAVRLRFDYSSYQSFSRLRSISETLDPQYLPIFDDTLEYRQVSQTLAANIDWQLGSQSVPQNLCIDIHYQKGKNDAYDYYLNNQLQYQIGWQQRHRLSVSMIHSLRPDQAQSVHDLGALLSYSSIFLEKRLRLRVSSHYQNTVGQDAYMLSFQSTGQFSITDRQQVGLQLKAWLRGHGQWQGGLSLNYQITL